MTCALAPFAHQLHCKYQSILAGREIMIKSHPSTPPTRIRTCLVRTCGDGSFRMFVMFKEGKGYAAAIETHGVIGPNGLSHPFDWVMSACQYAVKFGEKWIDLDLFFRSLIKSDMPLCAPSSDVIDRVSATTLVPFEAPFVADPLNHPYSIDSTMFDVLEQIIAKHLLPELAKPIVSYIATKL